MQMLGNPVTAAAEELSTDRLPRAAVALFFLMLVVPTTHSTIKLVLLAPLLLAALTSSRFRPPLRSVGLILAVAALGAFEVAYGLFRGTAGASSQWTVFILWPLVFYVLSWNIDTFGRLISLFRVMVAASWAIGLYGLTYVLVEMGRIPPWLYWEGIEAGQGIYIAEGAVAFNLYALSSVLFLLPALLALAITWPRRTSPPVPWWCLGGAIVLLLLVMLVSGRRAIVLNFVLFPVLLICFLKLGKTGGSRRALFVGSMAVPFGLVAARLLGLNLELVGEYLLEGEVKSYSSAVRVAQLSQLLDAWRADNIFLGSGLGAVAPGPVRSVETPWAYELTYIALLFHIGLLGLIVYGIVILSTYARMIARARKSSYVRPWAAAVFVGGLSFLLGTASNPYLMKFDYFWVLFLPVAVARLAGQDVFNRTAVDAPVYVAAAGSRQRLPGVAFPDMSRL